MFIAIIKLLEVLARSMFILATSFTLPIEEAGKFGIIVTVISLFSFVISWERYIDLQRVVAGEDKVSFDRNVLDTIQFFIFNYAIFLPIFIFFLGIWVDLSWPLIALCVLILVGEQVSQQSYLIALLNKVYKVFLWILLARSLVLLISVLAFILINNGSIDLDYVACAWAATSLATVMVISTMWKFKTDHGRHQNSFSFKERIFKQHKASLIHFSIGLLSVLALQFDRLAVGTLLSFTDAGMYFRNVMLAGFLLQFVNIACYNRMMPTLLAMGKQGEHQRQIRCAMRELVKTLTVCVLGGLALLVLDKASGGVLFERYALSWLLIVPLFCAVFVRTSGDFGALILHSRHREKRVLAAQAMSVCAGLVLLVFFAPRFQAFGVALVALCTAFLYATVTIIFVKSLLRNQSI